MKTHWASLFSLTFFPDKMFPKQSDSISVCEGYAEISKKIKASLCMQNLCCKLLWEPKFLLSIQRLMSFIVFRLLIYRA